MPEFDETAPTNSTSRQSGLIERFWMEHPCVGAFLTALFLGLVGLGAEAVLYPITRNQSFSWELTSVGLLAVPFYFLVFYVIFRRMRSAKSKWDLIVDHIFHKHALIASSLLALLVGSLAMAKDAIVWMIAGTPMNWSVLPFALAKAAFCFVVIYSVHRLLSDGQDDSLNS